MTTNFSRINRFKARWRSFRRSCLITTASWQVYEVANDGMHRWCECRAYYAGVLLYFDYGPDIDVLLVKMNNWLDKWREGKS